MRQNSDKKEANKYSKEGIRVVNYEGTILKRMRQYFLEKHVVEAISNYMQIIL